MKVMARDTMAYIKTPSSNYTNICWKPNFYDLFLIKTCLYLLVVSHSRLLSSSRSDSKRNC